MKDKYDKYEDRFDAKWRQEQRLLTAWIVLCMLVVGAFVFFALWVVVQVING